MKGISTVLAVILIVIIVVALVGLTYTFAVTLFGTAAAGAEAQAAAVTERLQKSVTWAASPTCTGTPDVIKFTLKHTGTVDIGSGEMDAFLGEGVGKISSSTNPVINTYALNKGTTSDEFSYTASDDKTTRTLTVSAPAASITATLTCS